MNIKNIKDLIKKPVVIASLSLLILTVAGIFYSTRTKEPVYGFIIAERAGVIQEVSATGQVKPVKKLDLAFEKGGKIAGVSVSVGDKVKAGKVLVVLDNAEITAQLHGAEANLEAEQARLAEIEKGTRTEELRVLEIKVENSKISREESQKNLVNSLNEAYTKSDSNLVTVCTINDATLDTARTNIASARSGIDTAISNLSTAEEELKTAESGSSLAI